MTKDELIQKLRDLMHDHTDPEVIHRKADNALLAYINDPAVTDAFTDLPRWYS